MSTALWAMILPVAVEPVIDTLATSGWAVRMLPTGSPLPKTTLTTVEVDAEVPLGQGNPAGRIADTHQADPAACEGAHAIASALWPRLPSA